MPQRHEEFLLGEGEQRRGFLSFMFLQLVALQSSTTKTGRQQEQRAGGPIRDPTGRFPGGLPLVLGAAQAMTRRTRQQLSSALVEKP